MVELNELKEIEKEMIELYKTLHQMPELGLNEVRTSALIAEKLREWGIETVTGVARTGVIGTIRSKKPGKTVALRADMDALPLIEATGLPYASKIPGKMHACGHDAHVSMLLGTARYFSLHPEKLKGNLRLIFQPAEEDNDPTVLPLGEMCGGAYYIIREGYLEDVDYCFALHVDPSLPVGTIKVFKKEAMAATDLFRIRIAGKGGHGGAPYKAVDVIPPLAGLLSAVNTVIPREINPFEAAVLSVGTVNTISSAWNATPGEVEITGTFRTYSDEVREYISSRLEQLAKAIPEAHRCTGYYEREVGYTPTVNDGAVAKVVAETAALQLGPGHVITDPEPQTGGEDVGLYFKEVPGAIAFLGCTEAGRKEFADLHNPSFRISLDTLIYGMAMHINCTEALQENGDCILKS